MKQHNWALEEECFGCMGCEDVWICKDCGADGGFSSYKPDDKPRQPTHGYAADKLGPLLLPEDCDVSRIMIAAYDLGTDYGKWKQRMDSLYENVHRPFAERFKYLFFRTFK